MQIKLLILDFDGTIGDTSDGIVKTMTYTFEKLKMAVPNESDIKRTIGLPLKKSIEILGGIKGKELDAAVNTYRDIFEEVGAPATVLFPHVAETLDKICKKGIICTIATSRGHSSVECLCRKNGINRYISKYVAEDDVKNKKPDPEAVELILKSMGVDKNSAAVVGDTTYDIEMGKKAGCHTIGAAYGNHTKEMLLGEGAEHIIYDFQDILHII